MDQVPPAFPLPPADRWSCLLTTSLGSGTVSCPWGTDSPLSVLFPLLSFKLVPCHLLLEAPPGFAAGPEGPSLFLYPRLSPGDLVLLRVFLMGGSVVAREPHMVGHPTYSSCMGVSGPAQEAAFPGTFSHASAQEAPRGCLRDEWGVRGKGDRASCVPPLGPRIRESALSHFLLLFHGVCEVFRNGR